MECTIKQHKRMPNIMTNGSMIKKRRRFVADQGESVLTTPSIGTANVSEEDVTLYWIGKDLTLTYRINQTNPDWRFLDTWYVDEVEELYEMNSDSKIAGKLYTYLCDRIFS